MRWIRLLCLCALMFCGLNALAQNPDEAAQPGSNALYEAGLHLGNLLPNQINGVTEIMGLGGVRAGFRLAPRSYVEGGMIMGNGEGVEWKNLHVDLRMDIPVENLLAVAYIGGDTIYYKGADTSSNKLVFGGHAGGGIMSHLGGASWFRFDMKFGLSPGTSLYLGFGVVIRMGDGGN